MSVHHEAKHNRFHSLDWAQVYFFITPILTKKELIYLEDWRLSKFNWLGLPVYHVEQK